MKPEETNNEGRTAEQADKIIAEFMGFEFAYGEQGYFPVYLSNKNGDYVDPSISRAGPRYSKSLDALVPVWEKLGIGEFTYNYRYTTFHLHTNERTVRDRVGGNCDDSSLVIQQAAAIATAKAILELKNEI